MMGSVVYPLLLIMWQITVLFYARTEAFAGKGSSPMAGLKCRISDICSSEVNKDILKTGGRVLGLKEAYNLTRM